jgi:predicted metal-dependent hydrolase
VTVSARRRTVGLSAEPGGSLTIQLPVDSQPSDVSRAIRKRMPWIIRTTAHQVSIAADHPVKEIVDGENFAFLGRNRRLLVGKPGDGVRLLGDRLTAPSGRPAAAGQRITFWYAAEGREWLAERVPQWSRRVGAPPALTDVRDLGLRWGVCTGGEPPEIAFHWALFQLPPYVVDFVVVHEVAHLVEPRHCGGFDRLIARVLPDHRERESELTELGRHIWLGATRASGSSATCPAQAGLPELPGSRNRLSRQAGLSRCPSPPGHDQGAERLALLIQAGRRPPAYARSWSVYRITGTTVLKVNAYIGNR